MKAARRRQSKVPAVHVRRHRAPHAQAASLAHHHPEADQAAARFDALNDPAAQMMLVRQIVDTRRAELVAAWRGLLMVSAGFRSRRDADGVHRLHAEPCVVLVVRDKWRKPGRLRRRLPARVLTHGCADGGVELFAVPTDVQPAAWYAGAVARGANTVLVADDGFPLPGAVACRVRLVGAVGDAALALGALHALSPVPALGRPTPGEGSRLHTPGAALLGRSAPWGGSLHRERSSFDAQLAVIDDVAWLSAAFGGLRLSGARPYVDSARAFDALAATTRQRILVSDNHPQARGPRAPLLCQFAASVNAAVSIDYPVRLGGQRTVAPVRHDELLRLRVLEECAMPLAGDSGSAVVTWWPDGSLALLGMFIASADRDATRSVYVLPAWQLFNLDNWDVLPAGTVAMIPSLG